MAARHSNRLIRIGSALSRSVVVSLVCRGLSRSESSCRAVELDTLTPRRMQSGGALSRSVETCRVAVKLSCRVTVESLSSYCRVSCQVAVEFPVELSRPGLKRECSRGGCCKVARAAGPSGGTHAGPFCRRELDGRVCSDRYGSVSDRYGPLGDRSLRTVTE